MKLYMPGHASHMLLRTDPSPVQVFKKVGKVAVRLLLIPGICEAFVAGAVAHKIFDMPLLLGFTLGFILKAVGPAIVIQLMFDLQRKGRGVDKGAASCSACLGPAYTG